MQNLIKVLNQTPVRDAALSVIDLTSVCISRLEQEQRTMCTLQARVKAGGLFCSLRSCTRMMWQRQGCPPHLLKPPVGQLLLERCRLSFAICQCLTEKQSSFLEQANSWCDHTSRFARPPLSSSSRFESSSVLPVASPLHGKVPFQSICTKCWCSSLQHFPLKLQSCPFSWSDDALARRLKVPLCFGYVTVLWRTLRFRVCCVQLQMTDCKLSLVMSVECFRQNPKFSQIPVWKENCTILWCFHNQFLRNQRSENSAWFCHHSVCGFPKGTVDDPSNFKLLHFGLFCSHKNCLSPSQLVCATCHLLLLSPSPATTNWQLLTRMDRYEPLRGS